MLTSENPMCQREKKKKAISNETEKFEVISIDYQISDQNICSKKSQNYMQ